MAGLIGDASKKRRVKEFRSSGTFPVPSGVKTVWLFMVGGGAGGSSTNYAGGGGHIVETVYDVDGKASCAVVIGAGGAANSGGGNTTFDGVVVARGGFDSIHYSGNTYVPAGCVAGKAGFGGHGSASFGNFMPTNNGGSSAYAPLANTGGGGGVNSPGGSGYLRVEWEE